MSLPNLELCPDCGAYIASSSKHSHQAWHQKLNKALSDLDELKAADSTVPREP